MREISADDLIVKTAAQLDVAWQTIFRTVAEEKQFSNWIEVSRNWFNRWFNYGELSPCVRHYCEQKLEATHATL